MISHSRLLISFLTILSFVSHSSLAFTDALLKEGKSMIALIQKAKDCNVKKVNGGLHYCTGLRLSKQDLKFLSEMDLTACKLFLQQMKFNVFEVEEGRRPEAVPEKDFNHFFSSTKLAYILHEESVILFKNEAKKGDCVHEVIHFYQRHRPNYYSLAPLKRKNKEKRLQGLLEEAVSLVEEAEKKGQKEKALNMAKNLQPFISLQREWQKLIDWLDEKEVYQAFFDYPELFNISERDYDVALANLVRLRESLPWDLLERVLRAANNELDKKYAAIETPQDLKALNAEDHYLGLYKRGKISRSVYEDKVIAIRKFKAQVRYKKLKGEGKVLDSLRALSKGRFYEKKTKPSGEGVILNFKEVSEFLESTLLSEKVVIDTGSSQTILPARVLAKLKSYKLIGSRSLRSALGTPIEAPLIQVPYAIDVYGVKVVGFTFTVANLVLPGGQGIIGMDFFKDFNKGAWELDLEKKRFIPLRKASRPLLKKKLVGNGLGEYDALEYYCHKDLKIRIDTGSQVFGDGKENKDYKKCFKAAESKKIKRIKAQNGMNIYFNREVDANLGLPFVMKKKTMAFDLEKGLYL